MTPIRVMLAGESWITNTTHIKGFDFFQNTSYGTGLTYLRPALDAAGFEFTHIPNHLADAEFPNTMEALSQYDVIILSDIGANTLLLHPDTWVRGQPTPNRLKLLKTWVENGGGFAMAGGYYSFAGFYAEAKYYRTPIEDILPVSIYTFDDRKEMPEGARSQLMQPSHSILDGLNEDWPVLLGFNELTSKPGADTLVQVDEYPLLAVQSVGQGRTLAWASDIGPHWCPKAFLSWPGYARLWTQSIEWLARRR